jgi:protein arginine kinase
MNIHEILSSPAAAAEREGPSNKIVWSSRVRLARNLANTPFPGWAKKSVRVETFKHIRDNVLQVESMKESFDTGMDKLTTLDKQILVERHFISREHAAKNTGSGLVLSQDESISVMINEEDHLRMQALLPGLQISNAWTAIDQFDTQLEHGLDFAYSKKRGYLTACPTNLGTGIRVSAMLHLPGLVLSEQVNQIIQAVNKLGLAVRGLYGEGTEALGNVFQVSNQMTLGETESDIVERLNKVLLQIVDHEQNARVKLMESKPKMVYNHIGRAYGILANAHSISSKETMNLLSLLRLGMDMELFAGTSQALINELIIITQPAHLQKANDGKLSAEKRDLLRADLLRERLKGVDRPVVPDTKTLEDSQNKGESE